MLTPEQTRLRIQDNEIRELKKQNADLRERLATSKKAMSMMLRELTRHVSWRAAAEYRTLADQLEASVD